ncbi:hypothetical protein GXM_00741 [Nostoc sphaeroides CCNUC1]|uniref:Uncharacterized protein n=1 Tax=Nostoc sphaeroides CCNUC1 TaxID=2653204 RepID=A0A5P8VS43_9NOSO|nr:hypothetical protein GXM_00741 [Nostoc sphaeroides CCNUC1]
MDGLRQDLLARLQPIIKNPVFNISISLCHIQLSVIDIVQNYQNMLQKILQQKLNDEASDRLTQFLFIFT